LIYNWRLFLEDVLLRYSRHDWFLKQVVTVTYCQHIPTHIAELLRYALPMQLLGIPASPGRCSCWVYQRPHPESIARTKVLVVLPQAYNVPNRATYKDTFSIKQRWDNDTDVTFVNR
jgi:hypothetical protein